MIIFPVFYCIDLEEKIVLTAIELGFSRNEVEEVYDQLWVEGVDFESLEQGINIIINRLEVQPSFCIIMG